MASDDPTFVFFVALWSDDPCLVPVHNVIISSAVAYFKLWHICQADPTCETADEDTSATSAVVSRDISR